MFSTSAACDLSYLPKTEFKKRPRDSRFCLGARFGHNSPDIGSGRLCADTDRIVCRNTERGGPADQTASAENIEGEYLIVMQAF